MSRMRKRALAAGKHVLVEKPLGVTVEECARLKQVADASGWVLQVGTIRSASTPASPSRTISSATRSARSSPSKPGIAIPPTATPRPTTCSRFSSPAPMPGGRWAIPKANRTRYYLLGHGSHLVDTARFLGGEIDAGSRPPDREIRRLLLVRRGRVRQRRVGHLDLTIAVRMDWHEGFQVYGEYGSVVAKTPQSVVPARPARSSASRRATGSITARSAPTRTPTSCRSKASPTTILTGAPQARGDGRRWSGRDAGAGRDRPLGRIRRLGQPGGHTGEPV